MTDKPICNLGADINRCVERHTNGLVRVFKPDEIGTKSFKYPYITYHKTFNPTYHVMTASIQVQWARQRRQKIARLASLVQPNGLTGCSRAVAAKVSGSKPTKKKCLTKPHRQPTLPGPLSVAIRLSPENICHLLGIQAIWWRVGLCIASAQQHHY